MGTIDLREVKRLTAKNLGKPAPTFEGPYLFWYTAWTYIQNKEYSILTEKQAAEKLKRYPKMETFYLKYPQSQTPKPEILKNRKGVQIETCTSHEQASELIYRLTGVKVDESDLRAKTKMSMADTRPLGLRAMSFVKSVDDHEKSEATKQRILKCLQENDARRRKDCLNNCK